MNKYLLISVLSALAFPAYADVESFVTAAQKNDLATVQSLIAQGENVNAQNSLGNTALHFAVNNGNADMVKFLLENGADASIANAKGWSPVTIAEKKQLNDFINMFQADQNNKDLSDLVAKASADANIAAQTVQSVENNMVQEATKAAETITNEVNAAKAAVEDISDDGDDVVEVVDGVLVESVPAPTGEVVPAPVETEAPAVVPAPVETETPAVVPAPVETETPAVVPAPVETETPAVVPAPVETDAPAVVPAPVETETPAVVPAPVETEAPAVVPAPVETETPAPTEEVAPKPEPTPAPKPAPKKIVKPVAAKPAPKLVPSVLDKAIYAGDEEIVYCLYYLGLQTEQHNLVVASEFFAGSTTITKDRYDVISGLAHKFYDNASEAEMKKMADKCSKVITPSNRDKQNQIIRSMNKAIGY